MSDLKNLRGLQRRDFLKWGVTVSALLGLERTRYLETLSKMGGVALADASLSSKMMKTISVVDGIGGLANWTLCFPNTFLAKSPPNQFAHFAAGVKAEKAEREMYLGPETAKVFNALPASFQVAAYICNVNQAHKVAPTSLIGSGNSMVASLSAIQTAVNPTLINALLVGNPEMFGSAVGAPAVATVASASGLVGLFSSEASRALLKPTGNAELMQKYHTAFLALNSASRSGGNKRHLDSSKVAVALLGENLGPALTPSTAELAMFGVEAMTPPAVASMSRSIITALKAMSLGLTNSLTVPGFFNDPHGMFTGSDDVPRAVELAISKMLKGFYELAASLKDPASGLALSERILMTITGDTMHNPFSVKGGTDWADSSPGGTNVMYVVGGSARLRSGWHGGYSSPEAPLDFNPETGATVPRGTPGAVEGAAAFASAASAVAFAVSGDERRPADFGRAEFAGLRVPAQQ